VVDVSVVADFLVQARVPMTISLLARRRLVVGALLSIVGLVLGPGVAHGQKRALVIPDTSAITKAMIDKGRQIYHGKGACIACHGTQLEGSSLAPPHRKTTGWKDAKDGAFPELVRVITTGVPRTVMVALPNGIKPDEAVLAAAYIWAVNNRGVNP
jgi:mono/diheme cytochrome c family protein